MVTEDFAFVDRQRTGIDIVLWEQFGRGRARNHLILHYFGMLLTSWTTFRGN